MDKVFANAKEAIFDIEDGATLMVGGFGLCGIPENLIAALVEKGVRNLNTISNNMGVDDFGLGLLLQKGQIRSHKGSYVGENRLFEEMVLAGKLELRLPHTFHPGAICPGSLPKEKSRLPRCTPWFQAFRQLSSECT